MSGTSDRVVAFVVVVALERSSNARLERDVERVGGVRAEQGVQALSVRFALVSAPPSRGSARAAEPRRGLTRT